MPDAKQEVVKDEDGGIGGDEPFCEHGNLLWSEHCDECSAAHKKLSDDIRRADASSYFAPLGRYWRIGGDY